MDARRDFDARFESLVKSGIAAAKGGDREQARHLLTRATELYRGDPRPWLWLSGTTDDPQEQRDYLENALAADPNNSAARRGLVMLSDKLDRERVLQVGEGVAPRRPTEPEAGWAQTFNCPNCGGLMTFDVGQNHLACARCGHTQAQAAPASTEDAPLRDISAEAEQVLDFVLPTTRAHRWAEAQHRVRCQHCGAITLLPPGQKTNQCPYCASDQLIDSAEAAELVDPQLIALFKIDTPQAVRQVKGWLGQGFFVPDDLAVLARKAQLRPLYCPFWTFDGALEVRYTCEVQVGENQWEPRSGSQFMFFDDALVPGLRALSMQELERVEPFELKDVVEFQPERLAGWHALTYDLALADASLQARGKVMRDAGRKLPPKIEPTREKRNLSLSPSGWSGLTFKHVLLPLFVGAYLYKGQEYRLLVNGQTGKVGGAKPRDPLKIILVGVGVGIVFALLLFWLLWTYKDFLFGPGG